MNVASSVCATLAVLSFSPVAFAQDSASSDATPSAPAAPAEVAPPAPPTPAAGTNVATPASSVESSPDSRWAASMRSGSANSAASALPNVEPATDHEGRVGHFALAYLGTRIVPGVALDGSTVRIDPTGSATLAITPDESTVPMFGVRYWMSKRLGIDVGLGFGLGSGSFKRVVPNPDPTQDRLEEGDTAGRLSFAGRVGVPVSVHAGRHYNLLVIPELDLAYSRATLPAFRPSTTGEALDLRLTGFGFGAGARIGGELSFGFWGVPQLSLQASWGLRVETEKRTGKVGDAEAGLSGLHLGTTASSDPWKLLSGGFALFYGF
jgi:hypothetical protein